MKLIALLLFSYRPNSEYEVASKVLGLQETCWYVLPVNNYTKYNLK